MECRLSRCVCSRGMRSILGLSMWRHNEIEQGCDRPGNPLRLLSGVVRANLHTVSGRHILQRGKDKAFVTRLVIGTKSSWDKSHILRQLTHWHIHLPHEVIQNVHVSAACCLRYIHLHRAWCISLLPVLGVLRRISFSEVSRKRLTSWRSTQSKISLRLSGVLQVTSSSSQERESSTGTFDEVL